MYLRGSRRVPGDSEPLSREFDSEGGGKKSDGHSKSWST